ncbi:flagellar protein FliO/FliZ [Paraburkholderia sp. Clong3]|uniref:flagellar biosynthetic protein FliO n=1 Tax=Paraburkholderia sp. Clong3 TaxID=2991061 RepID=UPI003D1E2949
MTVSTPASWLQGASDATAGQHALSATGLALAGVDVMRVGITLVCCIALGIVAILLLRRSHRVGACGSSSSRTPRITAAASLRLGPRTTLHLIEYDSRVVLLASDATGVKLLDARDRPDGAREA